MDAVRHGANGVSQDETAARSNVPISHRRPRWDVGNIPSKNRMLKLRRRSKSNVLAPILLRGLMGPAATRVGSLSRRNHRYSHKLARWQPGDPVPPGLLSILVAPPSRYQSPPQHVRAGVGSQTANKKIAQRLPKPHSYRGAEAWARRI
jgi:hypothetical protein